MWRAWMVVALVVGCGGKDGTTDDSDLPESCQAGEEDCSCFPGFGEDAPGTCNDAGLVCEDDICVAQQV